MSLFRERKTFVRRGSAATPTLRQFVRIVIPPRQGLAQEASFPTTAAVIAHPAGSTVTATIPYADNEDHAEPLSDSRPSAEG